MSTAAAASSPVKRADEPTVCIIAHSIGFGGTEVHTLAMMETLVARGCRIRFVSCVSHWYDDRIAAKPWADRVSIVHIERSVTTLKSEFLDEWERLLGSLESDVLILPKGEYLMGSVPLLKLCRRHFKRMYAIEHLEADPLPRLPVKKFLGVIPLGLGLWRYRRQRERQQAARLFNRVIAVSDSVKRRLVDDWGVPSSKIVVVRNGVRWAEFARNEEAGVRWRAQNGIAGDTFVFGMLTRLSRWKAIPVALHAVRRLMDMKPGRGFCLAVAGDGEDAEAIKSLALELGVDSHVRFLGHTKEPRAALSAFDVILFSSIREGLPLGLLEGMAAGCMPIVTRISGMPEAVDSPDVGWVVEPNDPDQLGAAMEDALVLDAAGVEAKRRTNVDRIRTAFDLDVANQRIAEIMGL